MTKKELADIVAEKAGIGKMEAISAVTETFAAISEAMVNDERIQIPAFGTFEAVTHQARNGYNPGTGETIRIPESRRPKFKAAKALKDAVK